MARSRDTPLLICYDGSENAGAAIERAADLLCERRALILTIWQRISGLNSFAWPGMMPSTIDVFELDRVAAEHGGRVASDGVEIARRAGLAAEPMAMEATGPVWQTVIETAREHDAAAIVMGSRGLTGVSSILLGSVSSAVTRHADRPTLVVHHPDDENA
jgi:nucleotide-binding universal stress UspA family protein